MEGEQGPPVREALFEGEPMEPMPPDVATVCKLIAKRIGEGLNEDDVLDWLRGDALVSADGPIVWRALTNVDAHEGGVAYDAIMKMLRALNEARRVISGQNLPLVGPPAGEFWALCNDALVKAKEVVG